MPWYMKGKHQLNNATDCAICSSFYGWFHICTCLWWIYWVVSYSIYVTINNELPCVDEYRMSSEVFIYSPFRRNYVMRNWRAIPDTLVDCSQYWHRAFQSWINAAAAFDPILLARDIISITWVIKNNQDAYNIYEALVITVNTKIW